MRILHADQQFGHHSVRSGYGQLTRYMASRSLNVDAVPFASAPLGSRRWRLNKRLYDARLLFASLRQDVLHLLYAENHLRLLPMLAKRARSRLRVVGTAHLPLDYYCRAKSVRALNALDAVIALTSDHAAELEAALTDAVVHFIPHGCVYVPQLFQPDATGTGGVEFVTVGSNYRDWPLLIDVVQRAREQEADWRFHMVGVQRDKLGTVRDWPSVCVHPRLDEEAYFALLNRCRGLFLPLTFATANNAILEAHNAGLPVCCSDLPGTRDYGVSTTRYVSDAEEALTALGRLAAAAPDEHRQQRICSYEEGRRFGWEHIVPQLQQVYEG